MRDFAIRLWHSAVVNAPVGALLAVALYFAVTSPHRRKALVTVSPATSERRRRVYSSLRIALVLAFLVQVVGGSFIGTHLEAIARIITIYPGSAIFYFTPKVVTDLVPELVLFFMGSASALLVAAAVLFPLVFIGHRPRRSPSVEHA